MNQTVDQPDAGAQPTQSVPSNEEESTATTATDASGPQIFIQDEPEEMSSSPSESPLTSGNDASSSAADAQKSSQHQSSDTQSHTHQPRQQSNASLASSQAVSPTSSSTPQGGRKSADSGKSGRPGGRHSHRNSSFEYKETLDATTRHLEDGSRIINQYKLGKMIGKGSYGSVFRACLLDDPSVEFAVKEFGKTRLRKTHRAQRFRGPAGRRKIAPPMRGGQPISDTISQSIHSGMQALKVGSSDEQSKQRGQSLDRTNNPEDPLSLIGHEVAILKKLHHPHLVHLYEVLDDPTMDELYMVFEYCPDGTVIDVRLHEQVKPIDESIARSYLIQIMLGIEYLHYHDIVHRDIKPDNILLQDNRKTCKIVDFGVSEFFVKPGDDTMQKSTGSPAFMSPELCKAGHGDFHGKDSDLWSLGVTFYCMVVGRLPFDKNQFLELYESIQKDEPDYPSHLSDECKDLLRQMLAKEPDNRITLAKMREHPFITDHGKEEVMSVEENIQDVVDEVTPEELATAIVKIASVFTLARAISKFKRAGSRASSAGSLSDLTSSILTKGKEITQYDSEPVKESGKDEAGAGKEDEQRQKDEQDTSKDPTPSQAEKSSGESPSLEQVAEAHVVMGTSNRKWAAQHVAKTVLRSKDAASLASGQGDKQDEPESGPQSGQKREKKEQGDGPVDSRSAHGEDKNEDLAAPQAKGEGEQTGGGDVSSSRPERGNGSNDGSEKRPRRREEVVHPHQHNYQVGHEIISKDLQQSTSDSDGSEKRHAAVPQGDGENGESSKRMHNVARPKLLPDQPTVQSPFVDDIPTPDGSSQFYLGKR